MLTIAQEQRQYETYILTDSTVPARLEVVPERGGIITRWQVAGQDILYLDTDRFANPELSIRGGIPILFPICGNLPGNTYSYDGRTYTLKQHGFARDLPWQVVQQTTQEAVSLTVRLESTEQTRLVYPFEFILDFTYRLEGTRLTIDQTYTNRSAVPMPFSTGLHPYFQVADKSQLQFTLPASQYQNQIDQTVHPFSGQFDFDQAELDMAFRPVEHHQATVIDRHQHTQLTLGYDAAYSTLVFWTIQGKDYYCLEPWTAPRNALNTGTSLIQLPAGATVATQVQLTIDKFDFQS